MKSTPAIPLPDPRSMESALAAIGRGAAHYASDEALFRAQDLMYEAFEARGARRRRRAGARPSAVRGRRRLLLGHPRDAFLYARSCRARRDALGARPAGGGGRAPTRASAVEPERQPGVRYRQAEYLLWLEFYEELDGLFAAYEDDAAAAFAFTKALAAFRREGDSAQAKRLLEEAREANPHVAAYLPGHKRLPKRLPDYVGFGDESEAVDYAAGAAALWAVVPGALAWLES